MKRRCPWCDEMKRFGEKYKLDWSVVDGETGAYVHNELVHFCFWCGRPLDAIGERIREEQR